MLWIKRNMFLAVGGLLALLAVGAGGYYLFTSIGQNSKLDEELKTLQGKMDGLMRMNPFPSATNIAAGKKEVERMKEVVVQSQPFFTPLPFEKVTGLPFKTILDKTIFELDQKAKSSRIQLPEQTYYFSFAAQKETLNLDPDSHPAINQQLAEVKAIVDILFNAKINTLVGLKRVAVSKDDNRAAKDYKAEWQLESNSVTGATLSPYEVAFVCFSSDLGRILDDFAKSKHGFVVRATAIDRFGEQAAPNRGIPRPGMTMPVRPLTPGPRPPPLPGAGAPPPAGAVQPQVGVPPVPNRPPAAAGAAAAAPAAGPNENKTILNEERFLAVLWVAVIRPPGS